MTDKEKTIKELKEVLDSLDITNEYRLNLIKAIEYLQEEPVSKDRLAFKAIPRLLEMLEPNDRAKTYTTRLADALEKEGYITDAKLARESIKVMNGEKVAMATMDEEPVSIDFEKELYKAFGQVKDFTLGMRIAKWFYDMGKNSQEPVSEDLEEAVNTYIGYPPEVDECSSVYGKRQAFKAGAKWQKQQDSIPSKDLAELIDTLSKRYPEVSFAKLSRIAIRIAKWQKTHLWKLADGDDLPEIDREVIALLDNGNVVFAHRPPYYWDGKDIVTGKVTRNYPKTYDKCGWNIPDVKYWLDCYLPKEKEEL